MKRISYQEISALIQEGKLTEAKKRLSTFLAQGSGDDSILNLMKLYMELTIAFHEEYTRSQQELLYMHDSLKKKQRVAQDASKLKSLEDTLKSYKKRL